MLLGCGGGRADDDEAAAAFFNQGWISVEVPKTPPAGFVFTTEDESIEIAGSAFISPNAHCCSNPDTGVTVKWSNDRGGSGSQSSGGSVCGFFGLIETLCDNRWLFDGVPLAAGINIITITAFDASNNIGQASITIRRNDTTAPDVKFTRPLNNQRNVGPIDDIVVTFTEAMDATT